MRYFFNNLGHGLSAMISTHGYFTINKDGFVSDDQSSSIYTGSTEELRIPYSEEFDDIFIPGVSGDVEGKEEAKAVGRLFSKWWKRNKAKITAKSSNSKISPLGN